MVIFLRCSSSSKAYITKSGQLVHLSAHSGMFLKISSLLQPLCSLVSSSVAREQKCRDFYKAATTVEAEEQAVDPSVQNLMNQHCVYMTRVERHSDLIIFLPKNDSL